MSITTTNQLLPQIGGHIAHKNSIATGTAHVTSLASFPDRQNSYREMPGNENSYREMPGNENAARKKSSLAGHMYTYVCMWRVGREGKITYGPRG